MFEPIALEVLLTPRKKVLANIPNEKFDVMLRLRAHENPNINLIRTPLAISIVIDRSGSMSGSKLEQAKSSAIDIVKRLHEDDRVSVIVYDDKVDVLLDLMPASAAIALIQPKLEEVFANGSTNLHGGWLKGAELLAPRTNGKELCRVILLSDGQANQGMVDIDRICGQVSDLARAGISTTTVGFGLGFNEELMTAIAHAGQGNAWYGERVEDLMESFDSEMSYLSRLVFKEVEIVANYAGRKLQMRNDFRSVRRNTWRLSGIAIGSEKWMAFSMPMREVIEVQNSGSIIELEIHLTDSQGQKHKLSAKLLEQSVVSVSKYREAEEDKLVARRFEEVEMADIQREARGLVREGDWIGVESMIDDLEYKAQNNPWVLETVKYLRKLLNRRDAQRMEKELMYSSHSMKNRVADLEDNVLFCMSEEANKPAFLRKKTTQGRNTDSQG
jgi:Ca-activated chloride channel family protein